ncbi:dihydroxyacetone kinase subunit DhaK [Vibrio metschnikovii]|uniref:dihydroxyacetone kinase subunit DhaK n=1 Tax=Vibrio metschnikovii TaxID=28172 RepID=UPI001C3054F0|nr:dihydroxyacetone kinase subunit DhaK [Vibrio metschnikovii]
MSVYNVFDGQFLSCSPSPVAVISGGGQGHEPLHSEFVGRGMLAAACIGEHFTAPSALQITDHVNAHFSSSIPILFLVKNHTGDVLNFQLATEWLTEQGYQVDFCLVDDDCAPLPAHCMMGGKGLAGIVLLQKLLGAYSLQLADSGLSGQQQLSVLVKQARQWTAQCHTISVGFEGAQAPKPEQRIDQIKVGVGLHNEQGIMQLTSGTFAEVLQHLQQLLANAPQRDRLQIQWSRAVHDWQQQFITMPLVAHPRYLLLLNGLSGQNQQQLGHLCQLVSQQLAQCEMTIVDSIAQAVCRGAHPNAFSVTLFALDDRALSCWQAPVDTAYWQWGK